MRIARSILKGGRPQPVGSSETDVPVSSEFFIKDGVRVSIHALLEDVTLADSISMSLFTGTIDDGGIQYRAVADKTVSVSADGLVEIRLNPEDNTDLTKIPVGIRGKILVTTGAGDSLTVKKLVIVEEVGG